MKPYPKYKDSGIEWLGKVPEGWEVKRLKYIAEDKKFSIVDGPFGTQLKAEEYQDEGVPLIRINNLSYEGKIDDKGIVYLSETKAKELRRSSIKKQDVVIGKTGATIGKSGINDKFNHAIIASSCLKISPNKNKLSPNFLNYFMISYNFQDSVLLTAGGSTRDTINISPFSNLYTLLPSYSEQQSIANFLDQKTTKIDELIKKNERMIELLKEKRQAIISHAVTKGLDPNAKMKDSEIEWLGEIPEGWGVRKLRFVCEINPVKSEYRGDKNIEVTFLPMEKVGEQGELIKDDIRVLADVYNGYTYFRDGDVIVAKITPCFENGKGSLVEGLVNGIGFGSTEFHVLRPSVPVLPEYLYFLTYSHPFRQMGEAMMTGAAGQKRVPEGFVKNFIIGIPSINEQKQIVSNLKSKLKKLEMVIQNILSQIEKLKEYRQALISNVVTGKTRVDES